MGQNVKIGGRRVRGKNRDGWDCGLVNIKMFVGDDSIQDVFLNPFHVQKTHLACREQFYMRSASVHPMKNHDQSTKHMQYLFLKSLLIQSVNGIIDIRHLHLSLAGVILQPQGQNS